MTDALIEKVARTMCMRNGQQECFRLSCTEDTCTGWQDFAEDARTALAAIEASGTHVVVPVLPTEVMTDAGFAGGSHCDCAREHDFSDAYVAMLAARPKVTR